MISYLNKGIEKTNLRAAFFYSCIVESAGTFDTKDGGRFGVQTVTQIVGPIQIWRAIKVERRAH